MGALYQLNSSHQINSNAHLGGRDEPATLILDEKGMICDCSQAGEKLFGYRRNDLVWQHISKLFPQLTEITLVQNKKFNSRLGFLCRCGHIFKAQNQQGGTFYSGLHFVHLHCRGERIIKLILSPSNNSESARLVS